MSQHLQNIVISIIKILLYGLLLHFLGYNMVNFKLALQGGGTEVIWMWKEIAVGLLGMIMSYQIITRYAGYIQIPNLIPSIKNDTSLQIILWLVLAITIIRSIISAYYNHTSLGTYILAFRYDFLGFVLGLICIFLSQYISADQIRKIFQHYGIVIWLVLIGGLLWYTILMIKPGILKLAGYTTQTYEGAVGKQAPAVYYTQQFQGYPRNQFLFERPIHYGFWLTVMWPLFFMLYLRRRSWSHAGWGWILYGLNVITTFSRAARGVWIIESIILIVYTYRKNVFVYLRKMIIPVIAIVGLISFLGYNQIIARDFSNTGHMILLQQGLQYVAEHRLVGLGPGSVGPASYHHDGLAFNPENQFVQILIELGIGGFVGWMILYAFFACFGFQYRHSFQDHKKKKVNLDTLLIIAMSLGLCGLALSGLVLHSFVDRMIVLPVMILSGLAIGLKRYHQKS